MICSKDKQRNNKININWKPKIRESNINLETLCWKSIRINIKIRNQFKRINML